MRFWDSSAIVPLIVAQSTSSQSDRWLAEDAVMAIWTLTPVEVVSALERLVRENVLSSKEAARASTRVDELVDAAHLVVDVDSVKAQARRLLRLHPLRTGDALQLGAAMEWASGRPTGRVLHTLDARLANAALREGFWVIPEDEAG